MVATAPRGVYLAGDGAALGSEGLFSGGKQFTKEGLSQGGCPGGLICSANARLLMVEEECDRSGPG